MVLLVSLLIGLAASDAPESAVVESTLNAIPQVAADLVRPDGTLNLTRDAQSALDLKGWNVTPDSAREPMLASQVITGTWHALGAGLDNYDYVYAITVSGSDVYVGSGFTEAGGDPNTIHVARWDGAAWHLLGTTPLNNGVYAIAVSGSDVYVGGNFNDAGGDPNADKVAWWDGAAWHALGTTPLNYGVRAIAASGSDVYVGGDFTEAGGDANAD